MNKVPPAFLLWCCFFLPLWSSSNAADIRSSALNSNDSAFVVWSDEFDDGFLNTDHWNWDTGGGGWGNNEFQVYTANNNNSYVENGLLHITALRDDENENDVRFTSARINTKSKFEFKYGTVEARIQVPDVANGLWPAFWTLGNNFDTVGWPYAGEMDVMEIGQNTAIWQGWGLVQRRVVSAVHYYGFDQRIMEYGIYDAPFRLDGDFHVYRLEWTPFRITTFIDDAMVMEMDIANCAFCEELHQPHFLILNLAVGGGFTYVQGDPLGPERITASFPATMLVDYVRVYNNTYTRLFGTTASIATTSPTTTNQSISPTTALPSLQPSTVAPTQEERLNTIAPTKGDTSFPPSRTPVTPTTTSPEPTTAEPPITTVPVPVILPLTNAPSAVPSHPPSLDPTNLPTSIPPPTAVPTTRPSHYPSQPPSHYPTEHPTTLRPTSLPTKKTSAPTSRPSSLLASPQPSQITPILSPPTTIAPTTQMPTTVAPVIYPKPSLHPSETPTLSPTSPSPPVATTSNPSTPPTMRPTNIPRSWAVTFEPTRRPTVADDTDNGNARSGTFSPTKASGSPTRSIWIVLCIGPLMALFLFFVIDVD